MKAVYCIFLIICFILTIPAEVLEDEEVFEEEVDDRSHYSRSIRDMIYLLHFNDVLVGHMDQLTLNLAEKIATLRLGIEDMKTRHESAAQNMSEFLGNSLNSFSLLRHMQSDWLYWQLYMEETDSFELNNLNELKPYLPMENDFTDAAEGLRRLQVVYQLSSLDMANGLLDGVQYNATLTPLDCFALAKYNSDYSYWQAAEQWLLATIWRFDQPNNRAEIHKLHGFRLDTVYDELARVRLKQNKNGEALHAQRKALDLAPRDANLLQKFHSLQTNIFTFPSISNISTEARDHDNLIDVLPYCCSGKCEVSRNLQLYCLYNTKESYYLRIAPVKVEILSLEPYIALYHDVILPSEQEFIKTQSSLYLSVTQTVDPRTNQFSTDFRRTAKAVWYNNTASDVYRRISQRIEDITKLDSNAGDEYQVINYGIGGLFETHFDSLYGDEARYKGDYDRLATFVFYLQDVPQGGATLFSNISLAVFPKAGAALFWYNLDNAGNAVKDIAHTGCPVIVGSKWIITKWLHDLGNELRAEPCTNELV